MRKRTAIFSSHDEDNHVFAELDEWEQALSVLKYTQEGVEVGCVAKLDCHLPARYGLPIITP
jgi:hypothetical protein